MDLENLYYIFQIMLAFYLMCKKDKQKLTKQKNSNESGNFRFRGFSLTKIGINTIIA